MSQQEEAEEANLRQQLLERDVSAYLPKNVSCPQRPSDVKWLLQRDVFDEGNPQKLAEILKERGNRVEWCDYVPFGGGEYGVYPDNDCVVVHGSVNLIRRLCKSKNWQPLAWFEQEPLRCTSYYSHWGQFILQHEYSFTTWAELLRKQEDHYYHHSEDGMIFIRPNENVKQFDGVVVHIDNFRDWHKTINDQVRPEFESLVVVAQPREIQAEWRVVICEGKAITASLYKENGKPVSQRCSDPELFEFAERVAAVWSPLPIYVLDVARVDAPCGLRNLWVVECGSINMAGLYNCDLDLVVDSMSALALKTWQDINT